MDFKVPSNPNHLMTLGKSTSSSSLCTGKYMLLLWRVTLLTNTTNSKAVTFFEKIFWSEKHRVAASALMSPHMSKESSVTVANRTPVIMGIRDKYTWKRNRKEQLTSSNNFQFKWVYTYCWFGEERREKNKATDQGISFYIVVPRGNETTTINARTTPVCRRASPCSMFRCVKRKRNHVI